MEPWFGPKSRYDTGVASWQGWLATAIFLLALAADRYWFKPEAFSLPHWTHFLSLAALTAVFLAVVYVTYDRD